MVRIQRLLSPEREIAHPLHPSDHEHLWAAYHLPHGLHIELLHKHFCQRAL